MIKKQLIENADKIAEHLEKGETLKIWANKQKELRVSVEQSKPIKLKSSGVHIQ